MKKKGVKRGTAVHTEYLRNVIAKEEQREHQHWWRSRQLVLDCVIIALGELLTEDMNREDVFDLVRKFCERYRRIERDVAYQVSGEAAEQTRNRDKVGSLWVSMDKIDRLMQEYVSPEDFRPFDERYDENQAQPYTSKDEIILSLKRLIDKRDDEITKLKGQIKLMKVKHDDKTK